jgi:predicted small secreted protein
VRIPTFEGGNEVGLRTVIAFVLVALAAMLGACNTIEGAGKDIERGGQAIRDAAKDVQRKM